MVSIGDFSDIGPRRRDLVPIRPLFRTTSGGRARITGRYHKVGGSGVAVVVAVVISLLVPSPAAVYASSEDGESPAAPEARRRLAADFSAVLSLREAPDSTCVAAAVDEHRIVEERSQEALTPASLMKVVTAAAALEVFRPDEVFTTRVVADSEATATISNGVLQGDLYLIGQGDPVLSTPRYISRYPEPVAHTDITELADQVFASLSARGVVRIEGGLVGDELWFPDKQRDYTDERSSGDDDPIWKTSFVTANDVGPLSALLLNSGYSSYSGSLSSAGRRQHIRAEDPARHAASVFDDLLEAKGMVITQRPRSGAAPVPNLRSILGAVDSPPVSKILARMLTRSDNTIAEMMFRQIGRRTAGSDRASAAGGVHEILRERLGPLADGLVIADGSGLSYSNRLTCAALVELLRTSGPGSPLVEGLAIAGETGSLRNCHPIRTGGNDAGLNTVKAKTGTLNHVTALAGSAVASNGETIAFAVIANGPNLILLGGCNRLRRTALNAAANYTYGPEAPDIPGHPADREALSTLFHSTGGDDWFNARGWGTDAPLNRWRGVTVNPSGRVTRIDLGGPFGNGLAGTLPEEVGLLTELELLDLSGNDLRGHLPDQVLDLRKLTDLRLAGTGLCFPGGAAVAGLPFRVGATGVDTCPSFGDLAGNPHEEALDALAARGVLDGTGCADDRMCPYEPIDRWTMGVWMVRTVQFRAPTMIETTRFEDIEPETWWAPYIERLADLEITAGCAERPLRFCPDSTVTRAQMASFLVRLLDLDKAPAAGFADTDDSYHKDAIDAVAAAGITVGCRTEPRSFCPEAPVTRGQMATFIARSLGII